MTKQKPKKQRQLVSPTQKPPVNSVIHQEVTQEFSGPLPHPSLLEHYNSVHPGLAERIVLMAEEQAKHRQQIERRALSADIWEVRLGQLFAFLIASIVIIAAVVVAIYSPGIAGTVVGSVLGAAGVTGLVTAFIFGRKK